MPLENMNNFQNKKLEFDTYNNADEIPQYSIKGSNVEDKRPEKENGFQQFIREKKVYISFLNLATLNIVAVVYFVFATLYWIKNRKDVAGFEWCNGYGMLLLIYCFAYGRLIYNHGLKIFLAYSLKTFCHSCIILLQSSKKRRKYAEIICWILLAVAISIFLVIDTKDSRDRLVGLLGVFSMMLAGWIFSKHPTRVNFKPVVWGLLIQFIFGLISIRWPVGRLIFECLSEKIATFLDFSKEGANFIFSKTLVDTGIFAFTVLPVLFFFSFVVSVLYYWGVMQFIIMNVGWALHVVLGTTVCESLHAATTLFLGMPESFLVIEPYLNKLTGSEIHAIMCSCFATTSGTVMAAYISFGAQPVHLITATVMSAPAGLCFAKLLYPETEKSSTHFKNITMKKSEEKSFLDAATKGALSSIPLVLGMVANVIAFVSAVAFLNAILSWTGSLVGYPELTFELVLAKVFIPLSFVVGVPWEECETVATLIGLKTVVNEFVAYEKLGQFKKVGKLSIRAEAIATYAICGFSNPSSLGIMIGSLSTMAPNRRKEIVESVFRAFIGGCAVCFLTASVAGILINEDSFTTGV